MAPERTEPGRRQICAAAALLLVAGCAGPPSTAVRPAGPGGAPESPPAGAAPTVPPEVPSRPSLGLFSRIKAPSEVEPVFALAATGVQIFRCEPDKEGYHWVFRLPEAELRDGRGQVVAHHGANYSFEHVDGSRLIGTIVGYDSAPGGDAVHWLLLRTQSYGAGEFEKVTYVQRVDTSGGIPPEQCSADQVNEILRVPFSAKFVFYRPR
ncbi:MAG: DUF3455 domain-containing protein [Betaproteobacteria bacterium]|jgi:hypothetical protein|nr:MAG: DUF3455 domain-containing protein [Betaproteobacteria bacterium]